MYFQGCSRLGAAAATVAVVVVLVQVVLVVSSCVVIWVCGVQLVKRGTVACGLRLKAEVRMDSMGFAASGGACLLVDSLLCFVFVSKELDPLSRYLKMSWRGKPSQRLPPWTPPNPPALAPSCPPHGNCNRSPSCLLSGSHAVQTADRGRSVKRQGGPPDETY